MAAPVLSVPNKPAPTQDPTPAPAPERTVKLDEYGRIQGLESFLKASGFEEPPLEDPNAAPPADPNAPLEDPNAAPPADNIKKVKIKHNGQEIEVPEQELLTLAQMGFDYTQKTQRLAEKERQLAPFEGIIGQIQSDPKLAQMIFDYWQGRTPQQAAPAAPATPPVDPNDPVEVLKAELYAKVKTDLLAELKGQTAQAVQSAVAPISHEQHIQRIQQDIMRDPLYPQVQKSLSDMVKALPREIGVKVFHELDQNPQAYLAAYREHRERIEKATPPATPSAQPQAGVPPAAPVTRAPILESSGGAPPPAPANERQKRSAKAKASALREGNVASLSNWLLESGALEHMRVPEQET